MVEGLPLFVEVLEGSDEPWIEIDIKVPAVVFVQSGPVPRVAIDMGREPGDEFLEPGTRALVGQHLRVQSGTAAFPVHGRLLSPS
jgi:hypothetical protein